MDLNPVPVVDPAALADHLAELETRIEVLQQANHELHSKLDAIADGYLRSGGTSNGLPRTNLLSNSYLTRAFAVWGHYFVAQLLISIPIVLLYLIVLALAFSSFRAS